jgi:hypothetical protein
MSNDLMQRLAMSKKIMDKHNEVPRGQSSGSLPIMENSNATYNIPEGMVEQPKIQNTFSTNPISEDAVMNSKLPDEIKKLMIENPIIQPQPNGATLSDDIIDGATKLMNINQQSKIEETVSSVGNNTDLKQMIRDVVRDTVRDVVKEELQNAGLLSESTQSANEVLSLRVGKHVFEGKVLKIKKVKQ